MATLAHENGSSAAPSGGIVGYIRPPPGVREVVDKTAAFVARGGQDFEAKIRASDTSGKFNFLAADHPYHAYYKHKVAELQSGGSASATSATAAKPTTSAAASETSAGAATNSVAGAPAAAAAADSGSAANDDAATAASAGASAGKAAAPAVLEAPPPPNPLSRALKALGDPAALAAPVDAFSPPHPTYLAARDIETIKLTAQFTAAQGKAFLSALAAKEAGNPAFEFLRPSHAAFLYFTSLVDQYHRILHPPAHTLEALRRAAGAGGGAAVLTRCVHRLEHRRREEERKRSEAAAASAKASSAAAAIDWHDFAVVETITFGDDEGLDGLSLEDSAPPSSSASAASSSAAAGGRGAAASGSFSSAGAGAGAGSSAAAETIRIRHDYTPGAALGLSAAGSGASAAGSAAAAAGGAGGAPGAAAAGGSSLTGYIDPRTGMQIPLEAATEHLRVELLDPKWRAERALHLSRQAGTLYAPGEELASNLKALAKSRSDVFAAERSAGALGAPAAAAGAGAGAGAAGPVQPQGAPAAKRQRLEGAGGEAR